MAISLKIGTSVPYPITITRIHVKPDSKITKGESIFQFTNEYIYETGNPLDIATIKKETRKLVSDYRSLNDATIKTLKIKDGDVITQDLVWATVEEECAHEVQFRGICGICGKDMTEITYLTGVAESKRAQISMVHNNAGLKVSKTFAHGVQSERQDKLLKDRKLSLVVDLDMTILHAVCDPTVGEWKNDPTNPNFEALQDVKQFTLADGPSLWYFVKFRNGLDKFLERISQLYEMHIYTMGTRAYANEIAKLIDPDHKLFGERIISRDENGSMHKKSLERLFPVSQKMVAIIDDRMDVWEHNLPHLVKVVPYDFFVGLGDIHASFLPKLETVPIAEPPRKTKDADSEPIVEKAVPVTDVAPVGDDEKAVLEAVAEEEKQLATQLEDRPLLQSQQKLDIEADAHPEPGEVKADGVKPISHGPALLRNDDTELTSLAENLALVHKIFYEEYDQTTRSSEEVGQAVRVQQMKPGQKKRRAPGTHVKENKGVEAPKDPVNDFKNVPNVGEIMPRLKSQTLAGCKVVLSGLIPLGVDLYGNMITRELQSFGAKVQPDVNEKTTHVVVSNSKARTQKVRQALTYPHIKVVSYGWLQQSYKEWKRADESEYLLENHSPTPIDPNYSALDTDVEDEADSRVDEETDGPPRSQEESEYDYDEDVDGILPDEANSPVDDLKTFNWGEVDDELADFLGSDADDDSEMDDEGNESEGSTTSSIPNRKRKSDNLSKGDMEGEENSEKEDLNVMSRVAKKQKKARGRSSGLKSVKNVGEEINSGLPTPDGTGGEEGGGEEEGDGDDREAEGEEEGEGEGGEEGDHDLEDMLEDQMFAELASGEEGGGS